jgi:hypothetical protein
MTIRNLIAIVFCLFFKTIAAQQDSMVTKGVICADLDLKGNVYLIDSAYDLCKINKGKVENRYSLINYGTGPVIDASNPLEIFVFYENSGIILIIDNNLNPVNEINLYAQNNLKARAFGRSNDGLIWVYDGNTGTLKKFDRNATLINETVILTKGTESENRTTGRVYDNGEMLAVQDIKNGCFVLNTNLKVAYKNQNPQQRLVGINQNKLICILDNLLIEVYINAKEPITTEGTIKMLDSRDKVLSVVNQRILTVRQTTIKTEVY